MHNLSKVKAVSAFGLARVCQARCPAGLGAQMEDCGHGLRWTDPSRLRPRAEVDRPLKLTLHATRPWPELPSIPRVSTVVSRLL